MIPFAYNLRSLAARRSTTIAAALGIGLVVFVFAAVLMLANGLDKTMQATGSPQNAIILRKGSQAEMQSGIEESAAGILRSSPEAASGPEGTLSTAEVVVLITAPKAGTNGVTNAVVRGVSPTSFSPLREMIKVVEGRNFTAGSDEVIIGKAIATRLAGIGIGREIPLMRNRPVKVVGIFSADGSSFESEIWGDLNTVRAIFNRQGSVSSVTLRLKDPGAFEALRMRIASDPRLGLEVKREPTYYEEQSQGLSLFIKALGLVTAVFFSAGAMIGAMITMYAQVAQRGREIGTMRALGFRGRNILFSFLLEAILLSLAGGVLGILGALAMSFVRFSTLSFQTFSEIVFRFTPTPGILISSLIFASVMGLLGGFLPAIRASRVSPVAAMRD
jgi:putative ABC transport system permease protein